MLKHIFGSISKLMKPLPTEWEKFSGKLANPEKYLNPGFVSKFQDYSRHHVHSHALSSYSATSHGMCVGLLHVNKDLIILHTKDVTGKYACWKWAPSVDGVIAHNSRNGVSIGPKSDDFIMNQIAMRCFGDAAKASTTASAEYMAVQKALRAYNRTMPIFEGRDPELKVGMPG